MGTDTAPPDSAQPQRLCRSCKSPLVLRRGEHGLFYGCSGYPYCKVSVSFNELPEKPTQKEKDRAFLNQCYRAIPKGSKLRVASKRTLRNGQWITMTRFDYVK